MSLAQILDRAVAFIAPEAGLRRMRARAAADLVLRHYEGANYGRRTQGWKTPSTDQNEAARWSLPTLRNRSRALCRDNPWASAAVELYESDIVGTGITPTFIHKDPKVVQTMRDLWDAHCGTKKIDAEGLLDLAGLQALMVRTIFESGEVLIRRRRRFLSDGLPLPFQLELLEPDHLDTLRDDFLPANGHRVRDGIQFDAIGRREGYWLLPEHPGEISAIASPSKLISADDVLHLYRIKRPKQRRGIPALAALIIRMHDLDEFEDAELLKQKIAACLAVFITDPTDADPPATGVAPKEKIPQDLESGAIVNIPGSKTISVVNPPQNPGYKDFVQAHLRAVAAGTSTTYEALSGDWSGVNYSSGRMGFLQNARMVERFRWNVIVTQGLNPIAAWTAEAAVLAGKLRANDPIGVIWTPPRRAMVDPKNEIPALRDMARSGLISVSELMREAGYVPEEVWKELGADFKRMKELGIQGAETDPANPIRTGAQSAPDAAAASAT